MGHIILPGHFCGLHCWVRSSGPLPEQSLPPNWGEGLVQFLCLFIVPPPQVTLQEDHLDHSVYPPLTILKYKSVNKELKQLRRRPQRRLQKNNRFNDQNNSSARASRFLVHFFDVHCTTTT